MLKAARITLILTAIVVGIGVYGFVGICMGTRNCQSALGTNFFWAMLVSAPFAVSGLTFNRDNKIAPIVNLLCLAMISAFVCFLFSSPAIPWNLISEIRFITAVKDISFPMLLIGTLPSVLIHISLIAMLCIAPKNIRAIIIMIARNDDL